MRCCVVAALVACSSGEPRRTMPPVAQGPLADAMPIDVPDASQDEQLAAIAHAMNQLDEAAQQCWAVAATERVDIEGELVAQIDIPAEAAKQAQITLVRETTRAPKLTACFTKVLAAYPWAPPLRGQTIQLPFRFRAPDGQSVIDRQLVSFGVQGKVAVAVLLDEANTGNAAASMFELKVAAGGSTGMRWANRAELWYFLDPGEVRSLAGSPQPFAAGDMMYVTAGGARDIAAKDRDLRAVLVVKPGAREGSARGGALPTREVTSRGAGAPVGPIVLPAAAAKSYPRDPGPKDGTATGLPRTGAVAIYAEPATISSKDLSASLIELPAGAKIPEHTHPKETEMLYVLAGAGTLTVDGVVLQVTPTSVVQIPPATKHAFTATADVRAVQVYTPAGPEQRFKGAPKK